MHSFFESFLGAKGEKVKIKTFLGHRFNMLFTDAAAVYYHNEDIASFLTTWPNPNKLLLSVKFDSFQPILLAVIRALGIVGRLITEPLEGILKKEKRILDCNPHLELIQTSLTTWSGDGLIAMAGAPLFESYTKIDEVHKKLFLEHEDSDIEAMTSIAIELIAEEMLILLNRQAHDYLPGGKLYSPSEKVKRMASNVGPSNMVSERDMAKLDNLLKFKPAASVSTIETHILWQSNRPSEWLDSMTDEEKKSTCDMAMKKAIGLRKKLKLRKEALVKALLEKLLKKQLAEAAKQKKALLAKVKATKNLEKYGGLWARTTLNCNVKRLKTLKQVKSGVLAQLKFHKLVLKSSGDKSLFHESTGGKKHTSRKLIENLIRVINLNIPPSVFPSCDATPSNAKIFSQKQSAKELIKKAKVAMLKRMSKDK